MLLSWQYTYSFSSVPGWGGGNRFVTVLRTFQKQQIRAGSPDIQRLNLNAWLSVLKRTISRTDYSMVTVTQSSLCTACKTPPNIYLTIYPTKYCTVFLPATAKSATPTQFKYREVSFKRLSLRGRIYSALNTRVQVLVFKLVDLFLQTELFTHLTRSCRYCAWTESAICRACMCRSVNLRKIKKCSHHA